MTEYGLGRLPAKDQRDTRFLMRWSAPIAIAPYRNYRTGPVTAQGNFPHCVGHSWAGFLSSAPLMTEDGPAPEAIYHGAQEHDEWEGTNYDGSSVRGGAKFLQLQGRLSGYLWAFTVEDIERWVLGGNGCVVLGTNWRQGMFDPEKDGRLRLTGPTVGGHAYLLYGMHHARGIARIQNSWSRNWGVNGRAYLSYDDLRTLLSEDGEACTSVEVRP